MASTLRSEFLSYLLDNGLHPGDRLPSLSARSQEIGVSVGKLREQMEAARILGLVEASPRRGITRTAYNFLPPVRLSLLAALTIDRRYFQAFSSLRVHLEMAYWDEAVPLLTDDDRAHLRELIAKAQEKLAPPRVRIPHVEHRDLHLTIFGRLQNPFVLGLLEAYWDAYEAVELNAYADYAYLQAVWQYHEQIVCAIDAGEIARGKVLLREHMDLLSNQGIPIEAPYLVTHEAGNAPPARLPNSSVAHRNGHHAAAVELQK